MSLYVEAISAWKVNDSIESFKNLNYTIVNSLTKLKQFTAPYDLIIMSISSFSRVREFMLYLKNKTYKKTLFLIDGNYGVYLETLILEYDPGLNVLSSQSNIDLKFLGNSKFHILNEKEISISVGFSCFSLNANLNDDFANKALQLSKISKSNSYLEKNTILDDIFTEMLQLKFTKFTNPTTGVCYRQSFCSYIWLKCIKMISFDVLSLIFEEYDYGNFFENDEIRPIYTNLINELVSIAMKSGAPDLLNLIQFPENPSLSLVRTVGIEQKIGLFNINPLVSNPNFLYHSNIHYCYAHNLELPNVLVLIFQPLVMSQYLNIPSSTLGFLYGLYQRMLNLDGSILVKRSSFLFKRKSRRRVIKERLINVRKKSVPNDAQALSNNEPGDEVIEDLFFDAQQIPINVSLNIEQSEIKETKENEDNKYHVKEFYSDYESVEDWSSPETPKSDDSAGTNDGMNVIDKEAEKYRPPKMPNGGKKDYSGLRKRGMSGVPETGQSQSLVTYATDDQLSNSLLSSQKSALMENALRRLTFAGSLREHSSHNPSGDEHRYRKIMDLSGLDWGPSRFSHVDHNALIETSHANPDVLPSKKCDNTQGSTDGQKNLDAEAERLHK